MRISILLTVIVLFIALVCLLILIDVDSSLPPVEEVLLQADQDEQDENIEGHEIRVATKDISRRLLAKPVKLPSNSDISEFPKQYSDSFLDYLAVLRNSESTPEVLSAIEAILKNSEFTRMVKNYLKSRNPVNFPKGWGFAILAESWQDFSLSDQYYDLTMESFLNKQLDIFGKIMLVVAEAEWDYLEAMLIDASNDSDPAVRFSVALALSKSESPIVKEMFIQLKNDQHDLVRAAIKVIEDGNSHILRNSMSFSNLLKLSERNKKVPTGTPLTGHVDMETGEIFIDN